ncbi:beta-lactamase family protein [Flavobacteriaceae bacterium TP-CH-4]|uniref:Beta-lactamase family protein n=1 Tax=Pelagihabitans pacificus TaxID=2696054 RepID=A0A967EBN2_9FLAO|nr:beta-lactamase family protein [Pelagihabitans pacificus]
MRHSLFYDDHEKIVKNRAYSYNPTDNGFQKAVLSFANVGATSLFTTVEDLSKWAMNFQDPKVGSRAIIEQMNTLAVLNNGETFGGAYGQFVDPYKGLLQIQHSGGDAGYRSYLSRFPEQDFAVSVVTNRGNSNPAALALQVVDLFLANDFKEETSQTESKPETFISLGPEQLKSFENNYWWEEQRIPRKVVFKNDTLRYVRGIGNESPLAPISKTKFRMLRVPAKVYVEFLKEAGEQRMNVYQENTPTITLSPYEPVDPKKVDLTPYIGTFYSPELDTSYRYTIVDGKLTATHRRNSNLDMEIIKQDLFRHDNIVTEFVRDNSNAISGIKVSTGRVRNLWFEKTED